MNMKNEEIIDLIQAYRAGMRIQVFGLGKARFDWTTIKPQEDFRGCEYRVHPADQSKWERIKWDRIKEGTTMRMTNEEIIDVVSAHKAGMRVQANAIRNQRSESGWITAKPVWNFGSCEYRVHPDDQPVWDRIKRQQNTPDDLPPLPVKEYGYTASGQPVHIPRKHADEWEIVPKGEQLPTNYPVPYYSRKSDCWFGNPLGVGVGFEFPYGEIADLFRVQDPDDCAYARKKAKKPAYGYDLAGNKIAPPDDRHEIIPEGTKVSKGEVTHRYLNDSRRWSDRGYLGVVGEGGVAKTVPGLGGGPGNVRAYARLKYEVLHYESGIEVGDYVQVVRKAETRERGWKNCWIPRMDAAIGRTYKVTGDHNCVGFELADAPNENAYYNFPAFVLEKVAPPKIKMVPLGGADWKIGDIVRHTAAPHCPWCITGIDTVDNSVFFGGTWEFPKDLQNNYERLDPTTGKWKRCEKPGEEE